MPKRMAIPLDRSASRPLYLQMEAWLRDALASGLLAPGTRLPAARALAGDLAVSRTTVEAAFAPLLAEGLLEARGAAGTRVAARPVRDALPPRSADPQPPGPEGGVDLSGGGGDDRLFPFAGFLRSLRTRLLADPPGFLGLPDPAGEPRLREAIARVCASQGLLLPPGHILVTGGSQQILALAALALGRPGAPVLVETPTYPKAMLLFRSLGLEVRGLPCDRQGPLPGALAEQGRGAAFAYLMPTFRNPTGTVMGAERRRRLVAEAAALGLPILEDDYVGGLRYEGRPLPTLKALSGPGAVLYTGTFSKLLAPGLGVGFAAAEGPLLERLLALKGVAGLSASRPFQRGLAEFIGVGSYRNHLRRALAGYRRRRDRLAEALARHLPQVRFQRPAGGLFLWVEFPAAVDCGRFGAACAREGVRVAWGRGFFADPGVEADRFLRLNFAQGDPEELEAGVERLGRALVG
jgi:GntR family transcriptional regulator/MocR family aminotransferase